ncbi:hypothetical protein AB0D17_49825, partial [Streptomyces mirabilis]
MAVQRQPRYLPCRGPIKAPLSGAVRGASGDSPYDDEYFTDARALDIDHLAEAWGSGASAWTAKEREAYANDLGDARALIAVSAASNRSKAGQDPSTWQPPAQGYRCQYARLDGRQNPVGLTIDPTEHTALTDALSNCPDQPITVSIARCPPHRARPLRPPTASPRRPAAPPPRP